jgi:DNA-binding transcriptional ArsR family regulator
MSNLDITPAPSLALTGDAQIRAYVHPTRMTILALLAEEKQSVSGVARRLGVHPANLTHHFKLLEKTGLIQLVEKRDTGKNLEKYYRAVAYYFSVVPGSAMAGKRALVLAILRDNLTAALQSLKNEPLEQEVLGLLKTVRVKPDDLLRFSEKLFILADEFTALDSESGTLCYSLNMSLYPTHAGDLPAQEITIGDG